MLLLIKSKKSRKLIPNGVIHDQTPNPREEGSATTKEKSVMIIVDFFRPQ